MTPLTKKLVVAAFSLLIGMILLTNIGLVNASNAESHSFTNGSSSNPAAVTTCSSLVTVTTTADSGAGSLRDAMGNLCDDGTINFDPALTSSGPAVITLLTALPDITSRMTIKGPGPNVLTIQRSSADNTPKFRIFNVHAFQELVKISGLTLSNGDADGENGGGIQSYYSSLSVINCAIIHNSAAKGGGIYAESGLGIYNSIVAENHAVLGGGIYSWGFQANITNDTVSGNTAYTNGGGILIDGPPFDDVASIYYTTVTNNVAGTQNQTGGVAKLNFGHSFVENSIIAGNIDKDVSGGFSPSGNNLIGKTDGTNGFNSGSIGTFAAPLDPKLGPLAYNGGPTLTHLPLPGSPAIGNGFTIFQDNDPLDLDSDGNTTETLPVDQRGFSRTPRPDELRSIGGAITELGSVKVNYVTTAIEGTPQSVVINTPFPTLLKAVVTESGRPMSGVLVTFTAPATGPSGTFSGSATVAADANGAVTAPPFVANGTAGSYNVSAGFPGGLSAAFSLTNMKGSQAITFNALPDKTYGDPDFGLSATASSSLPVSFSATGNCSVTGNTVHITGAGSCTITAKQAGNSNYNAAVDVSQSFSIAKANQTITFGALANKTYGNADFTLSATASSGLSVSFSATGNCTVSGSTVHITGVGSCMITASQAGNANYNPATSVSQNFTIAKGTAIVTLSNLSQIYSGTTRSATVFTSPFGLSVTITYSQNGSPITSPINAGAYNVTATISDPNYQGSASGILVINKATPIIVWNNPSNIFVGTPLSNAQLNATSNVAGTFVYDPPAGTVLPLGTSQLSVTFTPTDTNNYNNATKTVQITVDPIPPPALTFSSASYGVNESSGNVPILIMRTGDAAPAVSVDYATSDSAGLAACNTFSGLASSRCDYANTLGTLRFSAGETTKTIFVPIVNDSYAEGTERFNIRLSNPSTGASLGTVPVATITIVDNETVTTTPNPIVDPQFFIRQQYIDFLGREPDPVGWQGWQDILKNCQPTDKSCDRVAISSGFFRSPEFQDRGYFVYRFYPVALGRAPHYSEFMPDMAKLSGFLSEEEKEANKVAFVNEFMTRPEFVNRYAPATDPATFVDGLLQTCGLPNHPSRDAWIAQLINGTMTRAQVLRALSESKEVYDKFYNESFVVMQYFGYLRRDPDILYLEWIKTMNTNGGDYRDMINGFMNSSEYYLRFGP